MKQFFLSRNKDKAIKHMHNLSVEPFVNHFAQFVDFESRVWLTKLLCYCPWVITLQYRVSHNIRNHMNNVSCLFWSSHCRIMYHLDWYIIQIFYDMFLKTLMLHWRLLHHILSVVFQWLRNVWKRLQKLLGPIIHVNL